MFFSFSQWILYWYTRGSVRGQCLVKTLSIWWHQCVSSDICWVNAKQTWLCLCSVAKFCYRIWDHPKYQAYGRLSIMRSHTIFGGVLVAMAVIVGNVSCTASSHVECVAGQHVAVPATFSCVEILWFCCCNMSTCATYHLVWTSHDFVCGTSTCNMSPCVYLPLSYCHYFFL